MQTAWRNLLVARRHAPDRLTVLRSIAWQNIPCRQAPRGAGTPLGVLSPGAPTRAAMHYINSENPLVLAPPTIYL